MVIKSRHIIRLVTLIGAVCLLFSFPVFADSVTALGNVEIYGDNNTVSTGTGTIQMQNGTVQVGSTNDSAQIVTNTNNIHNDLTSTNSKLDVTNNRINTIITKLDTINTSITNLYTYISTNLFGILKTIGTEIVIIRDNIKNNIYQDTAERTLGGGNYIGTVTYNLTNVTYYTYSYQNESVVISSNSKYMTFNAFIRFYYSGLQQAFYAYSQMISNWFYPLRNSNSQYWIAYNTDTGDYDHVNLATVFGYITWYLGQIYDDSTNVTNTMHQMTSDIGTAATTFQNMEQKEQTAINQIQQGFETFLPDPTQFQSFRAITWCSNYLQQIYLALGAYGTVIFIALMFGVCLQFIGYFRYK